MSIDPNLKGMFQKKISKLKKKKKKCREGHLISGI